jgi:putative oxidoreductase
MNAPDFARLLLRLAVAGLMLPHGLHKLHAGIGQLGGLVAAHGLPRAVAYGVYVGEVVAPILVLLGLWTRPAALVIAFNLAIAVWLAHAGDLLTLSKTGGYALELQALYIVGAICIALLGAGRYSVRRGVERFD